MLEWKRNEIKKEIISILRVYKGSKLIKLSIPACELKEILFVYNSKFCYYEFDTDFIDSWFLSKLDFSDISFDGVNVLGMDFSDYHNVKINPQTINGKCLVGTACNGVKFVGSFEGVDVRGVDFTGSVGAKINPQTIFGKDLSNTICNGVEFTGSFEGVDVRGANFEGCKFEPPQLEDTLTRRRCLQ